MPTMEALNKSCLYNGRNYKPGERFQMDDPQHIKMFVGWGKAKVIDDAPPTQPRTQILETAAMKSETESEDVSEQRKKRIYKRRDMRPEE